MTPRSALIAAVAALPLLVTGCGGNDEMSDGGAFATTSHGPDPVVAKSVDGASGPKVTATIATGLKAPWGLAFLPDDTALVTERDTGDVVHVTGPGEQTTVGTIDESSAGGEAGLLGVAVSPSYDEDKAVYFYVSTDSDNRIVKATFDGTTLGDPTPILTDIPRGSIHDGGRLAFGPDGYLYASTGDSGQGDLAQNQNSLGGKVLRMTETGKPAPGNPDPTSVVWTMGHRNVQGLAFDDQKRLWASEFGQNDFDELNLIEKGTNYGWPEVEGKGDQDRYRNPQVVWSTDLASPSGLAFADGHLWLGALRGERLWRITVKDGKASKPTDFFVGDYGRIRTVVTAPDGTLWVTTSNTDGRGDPDSDDDRILQVTP